MRDRLFALRYAGWFGPSLIGGFPAPVAWQGWAVFAALIVALAGCVAMPAADRGLSAALALAVYAAIVFWTYRGN